jgi:hypothetical protein
MLVIDDIWIIYATDIVVNPKIRNKDNIRITIEDII